MVFLLLLSLDIEGGNVLFSLKMPDAKDVRLSGDFVNWSADGIKMVKEDTLWKAKVKILPGIHQYKFIVDGDWIPDPLNPLKAPDGFGGFNSVFILTEDGRILTEPLIKKTKEGVQFVYFSPTSKSVYLAGDFNNWDKTATPLVKKNEMWKITIPLTLGVHRYKFIVDNKWVEDPLNPAKVPDGYGGFNSVITLKENGKIVFGEESPFPSGIPVIEKLKGEGKPIYFTIVWHQHQPFYLKEKGIYVLPWVRLHAIKDYYDMAAFAEKYNIHFVVNLTPSLLYQIIDIGKIMAKGKCPDRYLEYTMIPADKLNDEQKKFILANFFSANWDNMIKTYPRYNELLEKRVIKGDGSLNYKASMKKFTVQDFRDLQVWFNLAWFDPDFKKGVVKLPDGDSVTVKSLIEKGKNFSERDKSLIFEAQEKIIKNIIPLHRKLLKDGKIEVSTTPFSHPILPLIYDTDIAKICMPNTPLPTRFSRPEDADEQVKRAIEMYKELFGIPPTGMWPGEGALSENVIPIFKKYGIKWVATDEGNLQKSLKVNQLKPQQLFNPYNMNGVKIVFRLRDLSDAIGFRYQKMNGVDAANDLILNLYSHYKNLSREGPFLITLILDGENAWEWYKNDGKDFLNALYSQIEKASWIRTTTIRNYLKIEKNYAELSYLWPGSWINSDFNIWIGESQENTAWEYLKKVREDFDKMKKGKSKEKIENAYFNILKAEGSDWFWWYGEDQNSLMDSEFDYIFREYLKRVYENLSENPPIFLDYPVK